MMKPYMSDAECALLDRYIPKAGRVLEFGAGGSTQHFFARGAAHVTSVESDARWISDIAREEGMLERIEAKQWLPIHGDIGPTKEWGKPVVSTPQHSWLQYHQQCWGMLPDAAFDLILIDGRFRVACLCQSLLHCPREDVIFVIHDFWNRPKYHVALALCEEVERADTSVALRRKTETDWKLLCLTLQAYQFDPS